MSEVSCRAVSHILDALHKRGIPLDRYLEVLEITSEGVADASARIEWDRFALLLERLRDDLGGLKALASFGSDIGSPTVVGFAQPPAGRSLSAEPVYTLGAKWLAALFSHTQVSCEARSRGRLAQEVRIADAHRDSPELFWLLLGFLRATPRAMGLPDAHVAMKLAPRRATYAIRLRRGGARARLRRLFSRQDWLSGAIVELNLERSQLQERYQKLVEANTRVAAQHRDLSLLVQLGREITRRTHLGELAPCVLQLLAEHFHLRGAVLWAASTPGRLDEAGRFGEQNGPAHQNVMLRSGGRVVGRLDLWQDGPLTSETLLERFIPWVSLAVANALAFRTISDRTRRLEEEMWERRRAERELVQAQKLEAVGALAGGLAHDFNNILTAIRVYTDLVAQKLPEDHPAHADLSEISVAGDRVAALTTQLLTFSRRPVVHPEIVNLNTVLARMEGMLARLMPEGSQFELSTAAEPLFVEIDPGQLEQVVVNLVHNAGDAVSQRGGLVRVRVAHRDDVVRLTVEDDGAGMDAATLGHAFEPFFSTKAPGKGSGLGLTAAYRIVTELGGRIDVESAPGEGTRVCVDFARRSHVGEAEESHLPLQLLGKETVLLVDDDEALLALMRRTLEDYGYGVLEARSGARALRVCSESSGAIHALVADLSLGDMGGPELAGRVRERRSEVAAVIYLSAEPGAAGAAASGSRGERTLRKPLSPEELPRAIRSALSDA